MIDKIICFKKVICFAFFLFISLYSNAQKISGTINSANDNGIIYFNYRSGLTYKKDSVALEGNKFFKDFRFDEAKTVFLTYGTSGKRLYVFPGADMHISFNAANDSLFRSTFTVTGDYSINYYLDTITNNVVHNRFVNERANMDQPIDSFAPVLHSFRLFSDSLRNAFFIQAHQNRNIKPLHDFLIVDSINWYANAILSAMDYLHFIPTGNHQLFWQTEVENRMPLTFSDAYLNAEFYNRLWAFFFRNGYENALAGADSNLVSKMNVGSFAIEYIKAKNINGKLKEVIASQVLQEIRGNYTTKSIEEARGIDPSIAALAAMINDQPYLNEFNKDYAEKKSLVYSRLKGTKAPGFALLDTTEHTYALNDFKGKIVLIDVWASWCGPCIAEMPYLHQLEQKLKENSDFQLLSVSIDQTKQAWVKNGLLRVKPPGLALWQGNNFEFSKAYNTQIIPQMILLDKNGNYIDFNPPRASDGNKLYQLISEHLRE